MIQPADLEVLLEATQRRVHTHGPRTWSRFADWVKQERLLNDSTRGGGVNGEGLTDRAIEDHHLDRQASEYQAELDKLTFRLSSDLHRLQRLIEIANPETPKSEIGAGCQSCARDGGRYEPIHTGRYRNACRWCGEWRAEHGDWPPLAVVRWRGNNPGKRVPVSIVEKAMSA